MSRLTIQMHDMNVLIEKIRPTFGYLFGDLSTNSIILIHVVFIVSVCSALVRVK